MSFIAFVRALGHITYGRLLRVVMRGILLALAPLCGI